jgi:hypothetical protein
MHYTCYNHPERIAVKKILREIRQRTPEGEKAIIIFSPICQQCAEGAQSIGTPLFPLTEN